MRKIEEIKKVLENKEMSFMDLDKIMSENGFYSVLDDGVTNDVKADKKVVYTGVGTGMCEVVVEFKITIDNGEDEGAEAFVVEVTSVEKF